MFPAYTSALLLLLSALQSLAATSTSNSSAPVVDLGYAKYQGTIDPSTKNLNYVGLRYAAEPTGSLRFSAPAPPPEVSAIQMADTVPDRCFQSAMGVSATGPLNSTASSNGEKKRDVGIQPESEDCLFLNVYTPSINGSNNGEGLPVVVWIHGGAYAIGGFAGPPLPSTGGFDGNDLLRESGNGVVSVIIQYRLGAFGFLAGEKVKAGGALNAGLLDQQYALQWVQKHISKFGGDPAKVTLWGQSAGGESILFHLITNGGHTNPPLFRAAMTDSIYIPPLYAYNDPIPEGTYDQFVAQVNCSSAPDTLECLRNTNATVLAAANLEIALTSFFGTFLPVPVVDGTFIMQLPYQALKQGKLNTDKLLSVNNAHDGLPLFINSTIVNNMTAAEYIQHLYPTISAETAETVAKQYADIEDMTAKALLIDSDSQFFCPTYIVMQSFKGQIYKGNFAIPPALHGDDINYYFPSTAVGGVPPYNNTDFIKAFVDPYLNFAMTLDPNNKWEDTITPTWYQWDSVSHFEMLFNKTDAGTPIVHGIETDAAVLERCQVWESVSNETFQ